MKLTSQRIKELIKEEIEKINEEEEEEEEALIQACANAIISAASKIESEGQEKFERKVIYNLEVLIQNFKYGY
tara:strand:- start:352 stop:570 length:219 start_codon:yes stop_codon:yes gene_type:complete